MLAPALRVAAAISAARHKLVARKRVPAISLFSWYTRIIDAARGDQRLMLASPGKPLDKKRGDPSQP